MSRRKAAYLMLVIGNETLEPNKSHSLAVMSFTSLLALAFFLITFRILF